ncbi:hypothetical protein OC834_006392 [Tilletia horrida]|nr:hypothetical protein OC834_006392 [Tilletia horrida]
MPLSALPGELILDIVTKAFKPDNPAAENIATLGLRIKNLSLVSRSFRMATQLYVRQAFQPFYSGNIPLVCARLIPWLPDPRDTAVNHRDWWERVARQPVEEVNLIHRISAALALTDFSTIRVLTLDLRIARPPLQNTARVWARTLVPQWVSCTAILTQLSNKARNLTELHLRIPPQQEMITIVEGIIASNSNLRSVIIEIDSVNQHYSTFRPTLDLTRLCQKDTPYSKFRRFIIRAPTTKCSITDCTPFFYRIGDVNEFAISVADFDAPLQNWQWVRNVLQHTPKIERFDVSVFLRNTLAKSAPFKQDPVTLPHLTDLVLELRDVDSSFFLNVIAEQLFNLRIHSAVDIDSWHCLPRDHLPGLFSVNVMCPGNSAMRMDMLGIPRSKYSQNLTDFHNYTVHHNAQFLAYIQPYGRNRRVESAVGNPTTVPTPTVAPANSSAPTAAVHEPADLDSPDSVDSTQSDSDTLTSLESESAPDNAGEESDVTGNDAGVGDGVNASGSENTNTGGGNSTSTVVNHDGTHPRGGEGSRAGGRDGAPGGGGEDTNTGGGNSTSTVVNGDGTYLRGGEGSRTGEGDGTPGEDSVTRGGDSGPATSSDHTHTGCVDCTLPRDGDDTTGGDDSAHVTGSEGPPTRHGNSVGTYSLTATGARVSTADRETQHLAAIYPPQRLRNLHDLIAAATQAHAAALPDRDLTGAVRSRDHDTGENEAQVPASKRFRSM